MNWISTHGFANFYSILSLNTLQKAYNLTVPRPREHIHISDFDLFKTLALFLPQDLRGVLKLPLALRQAGPCIGFPEGRGSKWHTGL